MGPHDDASGLQAPDSGLTRSPALLRHVFETSPDCITLTRLMDQPPTARSAIRLLDRNAFPLPKGNS